MKPAIPALLLCLAASQGLAQTLPLLTEEAETAPAGTVFLEAGFDVMRDESNFLTGRLRDRYDGPALRFVFSPAASVELDLEWVTRVGVWRDPDFGDLSDWGDVTLRAKWRIAEEKPGRPAFAVRFGVTLPETRFGDGLGPNTLRASASALVTRSFAARRVRLHGNLGGAILDEPLRAHEQRDLLAYGFAVEGRVGQRLWLVGEVAGLTGDGMPGADPRSEMRFGGRLVPRPKGRLELDAAVRRGLGGADGTWGASLGLRVAVRP